MDSALNSILGSGIWLLPLVVVVTIVGLFVLVRYWQSQSSADLQKLGGRGEAIAQDLFDLQQNSSGLDDERREPYGMRLRTLNQHLKRLVAQFDRLQTELEGMNERFQQPSDNAFAAIIGAPLLWYRIRQEFSSLYAAADELDAALERANQVYHNLLTLPWSVAQQARASAQAVAAVEALAVDLEGRGVRGEALEGFWEQLGQARDRLSGLPPYLYEAGERELEQQAQTEHIVDTYRVLTEVRPQVEALHERVKGWMAAQHQAQSLIEQARAALERLQRSLPGAPQEVDLRLLHNELQALGESLPQLSTALEAPDAAVLEEYVQQADAMRLQAQDLEGRFKSAMRQVSTLSRNLSALQAGLERVDSELTAMETNAVHPLQAGLSRHRSKVLQQRLKEIGPLGKTRAPEQLERHLGTAGELQPQIDTLNQNVAAIRREYDELLSLRASQELVNGLTWIGAASKIAAQVAEYEPHNWERSLHVERLPDDLQALEGEQIRLVPSERKAPVAEEELGLILQESHKLAARHKEMRTRMAQVQNRLNEISQKETEAIVALGAQRQWLERAAELMRSVPFLDSATGADTAELLSQVGLLRQEMQQRKQGSLDSKVKKVQASGREMEKAAARWLQGLAKSMSELQDDLEQRLGTLDGISYLQDPAVEQARQYLDELKPVPAGKDLNAEQILLEIQRISQVWTPGVRLVKDVEEIQKLVMQAYQEASAQRQEAQDALEGAAKAIPDKPAWPASSQSLADPRRRLGELEKRWVELKDAETSSGWYVKRLGDLQRDFQVLAGEVHRTLIKAEQEQDRVEEFDGQYNELVERWQAQILNFSADPGARAAIRNVIDEANLARRSIQEKYGRGQMPYDEVLKSLRLLNEQVRSAHANLDSERRINIDGSA